MSESVDITLEECVRKAKRGDVEAFRTLVEATERMAYGVARSVLGNSPDVLDAVQNAYLVAFRRLGQLHDDATFPAWMRRITVTSATDFGRRRRATFVSLDDSAAVPVLDESETRWSARQRAALARALLQLSPDERRVCNRHYHWGWSVARLADEAGTNEVTMKKRLQRIRDKLRRTMEMQEQEHFRDDGLPTDLPSKIVELLARPSLVDVPENPVGQILERISAEFDGFKMIDTPEVIDLPRARRAMGFDPVYIDTKAIYHIDDDKILRYDLSLPMLLTVPMERPPVRVMSAGKVYRNDGVSKTHLEAFHQLEILELGETGRLDSWSFAGRILKAVEAVLPGKSVRITPTEYAMCTQAWELDVEADGTWHELLAWGVYIPRIVELVGGDPARHIAVGAGCGLERIACLAYGIDDIRQVELATVVSR